MGMIGSQPGAGAQPPDAGDPLPSPAPAPSGPAGGQALSGGAGRDGLAIRPQTVHLTPEYRRLRDAFLRPHLRLTESRYFWERWKPRLGPDAAVLIMEVRDRCNRALAAAGVAGMGATAQSAGGDAPAGAGLPDPPPGHAPPAALDGCTVSASELAAACGFSRVTLWRLLQREDVRRFIRVEHNYVYDRRLGKKRRTVSTYYVLMEDPLVEEDEARLQELLAAMAAGTGQHSPPAWAGSASPAAPAQHLGAPWLQAETPQGPTVQSETLVVDNRRPGLHFETNRGGSTPKPQHVGETILKQRWLPNGLPNGHDEATTWPYSPPQSAGPQATGPQPPRAAAPAGNHRPAPAIDLWKKYPEFAHYVEEAEALLGDTHSRGFYVKALKRLYPGHMGVWQRALGLAREQRHIRRSRAALFTRLLRTFAAEEGVSL
jgi:hypothetical protein